MPILRDLQLQTILAPDPRIASQVLQNAIQTGRGAAKKIDAALAKFDSDDFQEREQAAKDLAELGEPAAMAPDARRPQRLVDRPHKAASMRFFAVQIDAADEQIAKLRHDPIFLLDCLYSEDPTPDPPQQKTSKTITGMSHQSAIDTGTRERNRSTTFTRENLPTPARNAT